MSKKQEMIARLKVMFEEGKIVLPKRFPIEELKSWTPESDASLSLRYAIESYRTSCQKVNKDD